MKTLNYIVMVFAILLNWSILASSASTGLNLTPVTAANCFNCVATYPQNPTIAVGPTQFISSTYQALRSFNKSTGTADGMLNIDAEAFTGNEGIFDVWMIYNSVINRFMLSGEASTATSLQFIVNDGPSITTATQWTQYILPPSQINPLAPDGSLDFNQPAFDQNAWYSAVGTFDSLGNFLGSSLTVIPNSSILAGAPQITVFPGLLNNLNNLSEGFACPATNFDPNPQFGYLVCLNFDGPDFTTGSTIQMYRILNAGTNDPELGPLVTFTATPFASNNLTAPHKGNLFGHVGGLQVTTPSLGSGVHVRNHQLYLVTDNQIDNSGTASATGDRYGITWWQFDLTGDSTGQGRNTESSNTIPVLVRSGNLFDDSVSDPLNYFMVSVMTNSNSDMLLSFNTSGNNAYVNANYAFRSAADANLGPIVPVTNSTFPMNFNYNVSELPGPDVQRWGDQSAIVIDPSNNTTFWAQQPYAALQNAWGLQATQILVS